MDPLEGEKPESMEYNNSMGHLYGSIHLSATDYAHVRKGWHYPNHRHRSYEVIHCDRGDLNVTIGERVHSLQPSQSILIMSNFPHASTALTECNYLNFHFQLEVKDKHIHNILQAASNSVILSDKVSGLLAGFIAAYGHYWSEQYMNNSACDDDNLKFAVEKLGIVSELLTVITEITRHCVEKAQIEANAELILKPSELKLAHELSIALENKIGGKLNFEDMARELNYNRNYLTQCFKRVYGMPPKEYFTRLRIRKAKELLQETSWSVQKISESLSFASLQHFSTVFREVALQTPLQFRKQL